MKGLLPSPRLHNSPTELHLTNKSSAVSIAAVTLLWTETVTCKDFHAYARSSCSESWKQSDVNPAQSPSPGLWRWDLSVCLPVCRAAGWLTVCLSVCPVTVLSASVYSCCHSRPQRQRASFSELTLHRHHPLYSATLQARNIFPVAHITLQPSLLYIFKLKPKYIQMKKHKPPNFLGFFVCVFF